VAEIAPSTVPANNKKCVLRTQYLRISYCFEIAKDMRDVFLIRCKFAFISLRKGEVSAAYRGHRKGTKDEKR